MVRDQGQVLLMGPRNVPIPEGIEEANQRPSAGQRRGARPPPNYSSTSWPRPFSAMHLSSIPIPTAAAPPFNLVFS